MGAPYSQKLLSYSQFNTLLVFSNSQSAIPKFTNDTFSIDYTALSNLHGTSKETYRPPPGNRKLHPLELKVPPVGAKSSTRWSKQLALLKVCISLLLRHGSPTDKLRFQQFTNISSTFLSLIANYFVPLRTVCMQT